MRLGEINPTEGEFCIKRISMKTVIPNLSQARPANHSAVVLRAVRPEGELFLLSHVHPHCPQMQKRQSGIIQAGEQLRQSGKENHLWHPKCVKKINKSDALIQCFQYRRGQKG